MVDKNCHFHTTGNEMTAKERHKTKLLEYLGDPANEWPLRKDYGSLILNVADRRLIYKTYSVEEIEEIEKEALALRRTKYSRFLGMIDHSVIKTAKSGDTPAARLAYQRFENWSEKHDHRVNGDININIMKFSDKEKK